jgi:tRNA-dihydrouridine synthase A
MFDPELVAEICQTMIQNENIPVTVKCRLGVDERDSWEEVVHFIKTVSEKGGVQKFIIHARKAFLNGLNPKENRNVPPLKYDWVLRLKQTFPDLHFVINGGFTTIEQIHDILKPENNLMGCMVGRMAMNNSWEIARMDEEFFADSTQTLTRREIINNYSRFAQEMQDIEAAKGGKISNTILARPIINLFSGEYKGADFRKVLNQHAASKEYVGKFESLMQTGMEYYGS